ncbi:MAG: RadC family protein [Thermodesulfobacteriota bacterium]
MNGSAHYHGHRQRLRERFSRDSSQLEDYELLELLLTYALPRKDTKPLAKELLAQFGSLKGILVAKPHELKNIKGFGEGLQIFWKVWQEFWARLNEQSIKEREFVDSPKKVADLAASRIGYASRESFWVLLLDNKNRLLSFSLVNSGTVDQSAVHPREVFGLALEKQASGLILVHNHPGGDPKPSDQDVHLTRKIMDTAKQLGLRLLDHVIVAEESYSSLQEDGILDGRT